VDGPQASVTNSVTIEVDAPPSVCFNMFDDWARLVDFMDLINQIGLDAKEPNMGLLQCFYRWGTGQ
jgi:hypothetical protein